MTRRQTSVAYDQLGDTDPSVSQSAKCQRCESVLEFSTNGHSVLLEICPHCHEGRPLRIKPVITRRCNRCTKPLDERESDLCRRCIPRAQVFLVCIDCGKNARQTRCAECRRTYELRVQRARESERKQRLKTYWATKGVQQ